MEPGMKLIGVYSKNAAVLCKAGEVYKGVLVTVIRCDGEEVTAAGAQWFEVYRERVDGWDWHWSQGRCSFAGYLPLIAALSKRQKLLKPATYRTSADLRAAKLDAGQRGELPRRPMPAMLDAHPDDRKRPAGSDMVQPPEGYDAAWDTVGPDGITGRQRHHRPRLEREGAEAAELDRALGEETACPYPAGSWEEATWLTAYESWLEARGIG